MLLIGDLLSLPAKGFFGVFKKIHDLAVDELYNEEKIKEQLFTLQELYESGEISEKEYEKQEEILLQRLEGATKRR